MGILDGLAGLLGGRKKGGGGMMELVQTLIDQFGGVDQLMSKLQNSEIAAQVATWVGHGENATVTADQISAALGSDAISGIAKKLKIDERSAAARISQALPRLVDRLTPSGSVPAGGFDEGLVNDLLGNMRNR